MTTVAKVDIAITNITRWVAAVSTFPDMKRSVFICVFAYHLRLWGARLTESILGRNELTIIFVGAVDGPPKVRFIATPTEIKRVGTTAFVNQPCHLTSIIHSILPFLGDIRLRLLRHEEIHLPPQCIRSTGQIFQSRVVAKCGAFGASTAREYEPLGSAGFGTFELLFQTSEVPSMSAREGDGPLRIIVE
jgi:hypothetical protein